MDNYRTIINRQASTFLEGGQPDSAAYWLKWGEAHIPFTSIEGDPTSILNYAYRYAQVGVNDRALALAEKSRRDLDIAFRSFLRDLDSIEAEISRVEQRIDDGGSRMDTRRRRELQNRIQTLNRDRQQLVRELSFETSRYMILQRIYFMNDMDEEAVAVADFIADVSDQRLPFPRDREENRHRVSRMFGE